MSDEDLDRLDRLAAARDQSRSEAIPLAIRRGAREELIRVALERYREGEVGMRGAAEVAGLTIAEMMQEAGERGVLSNEEAPDLAAGSLPSRFVGPEVSGLPFSSRSIG